MRGMVAVKMTSTPSHLYFRPVTLTPGWFQGSRAFHRRILPVIASACSPLKPSRWIDATRAGSEMKLSPECSTRNVKTNRRYGSLVHHLRESWSESINPEIKHQLTCNSVTCRRSFSRIRKWAQNRHGFLYRDGFVAKSRCSIQELVTQVEGVSSSQTIESLCWIARSIFKDGGPDSSIALSKLIATLSKRLNFYDNPLISAAVSITIFIIRLKTAETCLRMS